MKTLYPKQESACAFFENCHKAKRNTLDTSVVGTGKTVVAVQLAMRLQRPVAVICPKAVVTSWERELAEHNVKPLFVTNYEKIRTGKGQWVSKIGKKIFQWNLPVGTIVMLDESHKMKSPFSQNAQLLISLVQQGFSVHCMSATAAEDPSEMRALGYALNLHALNKPTGQLKSWFSWMMQNGCKQDFWKQWKLMDRGKLKDVRASMYGVTSHRLTVADFPDSFKLNRVFVEPIEFKDKKKIFAAYDDIGFTPEIIEYYIEHNKLPESEFAAVDILRARQLAESFKAPDIVEMAEDLLEQQNSVVIFVNFRETAAAISTALKCPVIEGGQTAADRQSIVDRFQKDEIHCIVVNIAAGGTGLSLHDINGNRARVTLISPSFNAKDFQQVLGRIHRNGAKSDAVQKVLVAAGSIEEAVMKSVQKKIENLETLHGK